MKYSCSDCNYSTDDCSNWAKHNKTKSHLKKIQGSSGDKKVHLSTINQESTSS